MSSSASAPPPPVKDFERLRLSASPSPIADRFIQQGQQQHREQRRISAGSPSEPPQAQQTVHTRHMGLKQHGVSHGHRLSGSHRSGSHLSGAGHGASPHETHNQPAMRGGIEGGHSAAAHRPLVAGEGTRGSNEQAQIHEQHRHHSHQTQPVPAVRNDLTSPPAAPPSNAADLARRATPSTEEKDRSIDDTAHESKSPLMSRLKRHFVSRSPLTSTWEKKSFVEECRSARPVLEHERPQGGVAPAGRTEADSLEMMEQGVARGRRNEPSHSRPTSLYASPTALRAFNPLPQVPLPGQNSARSPLSGVHQNVAPSPAASSGSGGVSGQIHCSGHGAHSHHSDGRARHGHHDDHSKCRECDAIWNSAV